MGKSFNSVLLPVPKMSVIHNTLINVEICFKQMLLVEKIQNIKQNVSSYEKKKNGNSGLITLKLKSHITIQVAQKCNSKRKYLKLFLLEID